MRDIFGYVFILNYHLYLITVKYVSRLTEKVPGQRLDSRIMYVTWLLIFPNKNYPRNLFVVHYYANHYYIRKFPDYFLGY